MRPTARKTQQSAWKILKKCLLPLDLEYTPDGIIYSIVERRHRQEAGMT
ncbi:hypothetical protein HMPREF1546_04178 [Oscillibacter sp. KLE 1745]|nr:hypothetical protein HMPREF1546_04178 [Oscillibacter sp. KLE 1745]